MSALSNEEMAITILDAIGTQASAIGVLGDLLYAVEADSEHLKPETINNLGCLLDVISSAMLSSAFEARRCLGKPGY